MRKRTSERERERERLHARMNERERKNERKMRKKKERKKSVMCEQERRGRKSWKISVEFANRKNNEAFGETTNEVTVTFGFPRADSMLSFRFFL